MGSALEEERLEPITKQTQGVHSRTSVGKGLLILA